MLTYSPRRNPRFLSITYAQALPGTPLYEFARHKKIIGEKIDEEEEYLLAISDTDAADNLSTLNLTSYPLSEQQSWKSKILLYVNNQYVKKYGLKHYHDKLRKDPDFVGFFLKTMRAKKGQVINYKSIINETSNPGTRVFESNIMFPNFFACLSSGRFGMASILFPHIIYRFRLFIPLFKIALLLKQSKFNLAYIHTIDLYKTQRLLKQDRRQGPESKSLRKTVNEDLGGPITSPAMESLRQGR